jgi:hypothetical protein
MSGIKRLNHLMRAGYGLARDARSGRSRVGDIGHDSASQAFTRTFERPLHRKQLTHARNHIDRHPCVREERTVSIPSESSLPLGLLFQKFIAEMPSGAPYSRHIALKIPRHLSVRVTAFRTNPTVAIKRRVCAEYSQLQGHRWKRWTNGTAAFQMVETPPEARGALGANRLRRGAPRRQPPHEFHEEAQPCGAPASRGSVSSSPACPSVGRYLPKFISKSLGTP